MYIRDQRKAHELPPLELENLMSQFEEYAGLTFDASFADNVNNMIGIIRDKYLIENNSPDNKTVKQKLNSYRRSLIKVIDMQNSNMDFWAFNQLAAHLPNGFETIHTANEVMGDLLKGCDKAIEELSNRRKSNGSNLKQTKEKIATDFARELAAHEIKITVYRDGVFGKCLRALLEAVNGKSDTEQFQIYVPEDLLFLIKKAAKTYQTEPSHILRQFR